MVSFGGKRFHDASEYECFCCQASRRDRQSFSSPACGHGREFARAPARRYNCGMIETTLPLAPELRATVPAPDQAPLLEQLATLRIENVALRAQNAALQERIRDLEARLGQNSANSSRPPLRIHPT